MRSLVQRYSHNRSQEGNRRYNKRRYQAKTQRRTAYTNFVPSKETVGPIGPYLIAMAGAATAYWAYQQWAHNTNLLRRKSKEFVMARAVDKMIEPYIPWAKFSGEFAEHVYVKRRDVDSQLIQAIDCQSEAYTIVLGPRNAGKTTALNELLDSRKGVVVVDVKTGRNPTPVEWLVLDKLGVSQVHINNEHADPDAYFIEICQKVIEGLQQQHEEDPNDPGITGAHQRPVVWLEVHQDIQEDYFVSIMDWAKTVGCDAGIANVIINVGSRKMAGILSHNHDSRRRFIYVEPFTIEDAEIYLDNLEKRGHRTLHRDGVFSKLGTLPGDLYAVVAGSAAPLDETEYIEGELNDACAAVSDSLRSEPRLLTVYQALLHQEEKYLVSKHGIDGHLISGKEPPCKGLKTKFASDISGLMTEQIAVAIQHYETLTFDPQKPRHVRFPSQKQRLATYMVLKEDWVQALAEEKDVNVFEFTHH